MNATSANSNVSSGRSEGEFTEKTKRIIADRAGHVCSRPHCRVAPRGPHSESDKAANIGVAAHISGAAPKSARWDEGLLKAERKAPENGVWLCWPRSVRIDVDENRFSPALLRAWFGAAVNDQEWLLSAARAPIATGGTVACSGEIWSSDGVLAAIGGSTLLCMPSERRPDGRGKT